MSDSEHQIECSRHGKTNVTFLCRHLVEGEKLGFNLAYDPENPDDLCPDAWCDECDKVLDAEGGWTGKFEKFADIKVLCSRCYEDVRDRNWVQDEEIFHDLVRSSFSFIEPRHEAFLSEYKVDEHERWDWYQETAKLVFSHNGKPQVEADIQFSGTFSTSSNTWMWAWVNNSLSEIVKSSSREIKELGEELGLKQLVAGRYAATEVDGWEMTSVLAKHLNAIGVYRTPSDNGFTYMVITLAKWVG
ncbi:DUF6882 domain-containing protein [Marinicella meishanensis]|uniref:DUF6882 domain-containing protein n=1 Tax=Marinicella meishanensis TaxID=2873263 RepID=UPI001CBC61C2|nr:DUF6882 domain-containing protein [Marinicella sp. NBU2979]